MIRKLALALALALGATAGAEEINLAAATTARPNLVLARTGLDHALVLDLGYRRVVTWGGRTLLLGGDLGAPWASPDLGDYRVRAVATAPLLGAHGRGFALALSLAPTLRATRNAAGDQHALGVDSRLTFGYYGRWWCAGELGLDWAATTHVANSSAYREVYAGARDGWYANAGGTLYAGLNAGMPVGAVDVVLRAGMPRALDLGPQTIPLFALVGVNVALPE